MDSLNFLKFWRNATISATTTTVPHLVVETDSESDEEEEDDSFFDLELTLHHEQNKTDHVPQNKAAATTLTLEEETKTNPCLNNSEIPPNKTTSLSSNEPISKRKVLPIEPISKPQSPIALLKSAPSFRLFTFKKRTAPQKEETFAVKLNVEDSNYQCSPSLSRVNSTRSFGSKLQNQGYFSEEQNKTERVSKDVVQKYLKLIKPLYVRVSKRYGDKMKSSGEAASMASPLSSPLVGSVSSRKEKQGMKVVSKHLGKSRSSSAVAGVGSPANRSDDTLLQQHDGIQSAILHCKKSFNSRDSTDSSVHSVRSSFEDEYVAIM